MSSLPPLMKANGHPQMQMQQQQPQPQFQGPPPSASQQMHQQQPPSQQQQQQQRQMNAYPAQQHIYAFPHSGSTAQHQQLMQQRVPMQPQPQQQPAQQHRQQQQPTSGGANQHTLQRLASANEQTWIQIGSLSETMGDADKAMHAYEMALRHNPYSIPALTHIASACRAKEQFPRAVEYLQRILNVEGNNGEVWGALGHCYLMLDDLPKAYAAYQQALYHLPNPKLWYGIGILYDRYGSFEHAEEAFSSVIKMEPKFEKATEIYFRLGIIYKQQTKYELSLQCFRYILASPPKPLREVDIWFQIGNVFELQKDHNQAKDAYDRVLKENPNHAKVLQQLAWLHYQPDTEFTDKDGAISMLQKSVELDPADAQSWYLLGRCYMSQQKYNKAYEAYQAAVYRDGRNPIFWCSIGVLYYKINQFRDALDAYSRAIRLNPYISEVWYDLGTLYESCNNQVQDAIDAYTRAAELDPSNVVIAKRLTYLKDPETNTATSLESPPPPMMPEMPASSYRQPSLQPPQPAQQQQPFIQQSGAQPAAGQFGVAQIQALVQSRSNQPMPAPGSLQSYSQQQQPLKQMPERQGPPPAQAVTMPAAIHNHSLKSPPPPGAELAKQLSPVQNKASSLPSVGSFDSPSKETPSTVSTKRPTSSSSDGSGPPSPPSRGNDKRVKVDKNEPAVNAPVTRAKVVPSGKRERSKQRSNNISTDEDMDDEEDDVDDDDDDESYVG